MDFVILYIYELNTLAGMVASTISPPLELSLTDLRQGIQERVDALFAARWPTIDPAQRRVRGLVAYRLFLAVLPLALGDDKDQQAMVREMKTMMYRYWEPAADPA